MVIIKNKFATLEETFETHTSYDKYENFVTVHIEKTRKTHHYLIKENN